MAQTKTTRSRSSQRSSGRGSSNAKKASSSRRSSGGSKRTQSRSKQNGRTAASRAKRAAQRTAPSGGTLAKVASKAKAPLIAGGAALAGLAGGAALATRNGSRRKGLSLPKLGGNGSLTKALGTAAKEIGKAGYRAGELTSEVRKVREQMDNQSDDQK